MDSKLRLLPNGTLAHPYGNLDQIVEPQLNAAVVGAFREHEHAMLKLTSIMNQPMSLQRHFNLRTCLANPDATKSTASPFQWLSRNLLHNNFAPRRWMDADEDTRQRHQPTKLRCRRPPGILAVLATLDAFAW